MKIKQTLTLLLVFLLFIISVQAQEAVIATGGEASGSGGSASYTVGQAVYNTSTGTNGTATQGVQQPYEIFIITGIEEAKEINLTVSAYPNPAIDVLQLKVDASVTLDNRSLSYQLYNMQGKLLKSENIVGNSMTIKMDDLLRSTYFLKIVNNNKQIKTFKIIKN